MNQQQVINIWEKALPPLEKAFTDFNWENEKCYAQYLAQTYRYITHSCLLLKYAAEKSENTGLKDCLMHHDAEEDGHEKLALNDLKRLGFDLSSIPELKMTEEVYGTIYQQINSYGPAAIIGYALALEGLSARRCPEIAQRLINAYGLQKSTLIKLHGHVDPDHIQESFGVLQFFNEQELDIVAQVIEESCERYIRYLKAVTEAAGRMTQAFPVSTSI